MIAPAMMKKGIAASEKLSAPPMSFCTTTVIALLGSL